jgi:hypothetical protein
MTETPTTYNVVLLVEQPLSKADAKQVRSLHEEIEDPVRYHLLLPVEDAASRIESSMGSLSAGEFLAAPPVTIDQADVQDMQHELLDHARGSVDACIGRLQEFGGNATGEVVSIDPIEALAIKVKELDAAEAIILTRPHVIAEFFHVDWTSRARRKLGVPVLHLLEHENFDEQAGGGEGITGM